MLKVKFEKQAAKFLDKVKKKDVVLAKKMVKKILQLSDNPDLHGVKLLKGYQDYKRCRVGEYRILFRSDNEYLYVILISVRGDVYQKFKQLTHIFHGFA
jgi:mRNA interferase RelE/StbE